jgi:hypothetical protein
MPRSKLPPLRELNFGQLDAAQEAIDQPSLLLEGFYDYREAAYGISTGEVWLLLGPKGAGKTAVLEHLRLDWQDRWDRFFVYWDLRTFPVADVTQIKTGQSAGGSRSQSAWEFLLLLRIVESLITDETLSATQEFGRLSSDLSRAGLVDADWKTKVVEWATEHASFDLPVAGHGTELVERAVGPLQAIAILRRILSAVKTQSQHVIALDGLDSFFFESDDQWTSLAGLMHAVASVNSMLRAQGLRISIVVAVRSDIFDVIPNAESNKLKPHSVHLDWSALGIGASNALWRLVAEKAAVSRPEVKDLTKQYLASRVALGRISWEMPEFLLDNTRLLPRDLVALLSYLQQTHPGSTPVPQEHAIDAVRRYSEEYFVGEIFNNLAGILPDRSARKVASFRDALRTLPSRVFSFEEVQSELLGELESFETKALLKQMFEVGGIGIRNQSGSKEYTDFVYRKISQAGFTLRHKFMLHDALTRAWNVPWR